MFVSVLAVVNGVAVLSALFAAFTALRSSKPGGVASEPSLSDPAQWESRSEELATLGWSTDDLLVGRDRIALIKARQAEAREAAELAQAAGLRALDIMNRQAVQVDYVLELLPNLLTSRSLSNNNYQANNDIIKGALR